MVLESWIFFGFSCAILLTWLYLLMFRGAFWTARIERPPKQPSAWPSVVAVVPARNESKLISECVRSILAQEYEGNLHLIVVDDHSVDKTEEQARRGARAANSEQNLTVTTANPLPKHWIGKTWAMEHGWKIAKTQLKENDYVWFTDADIKHTPAALKHLAGRAVDQNLELVSTMVLLKCRTFWEKVFTPAFIYFFKLLYPFNYVNTKPKRYAGAAGSCMLIKRATLEKIGGMKSIRKELIDDCALAKQIKNEGHIWLGLTKDSVSQRGYSKFTAGWNLIARSAYTQLNYSLPSLLFCIVGLLLLFIYPPVIIFAGPFPANILGIITWIVMTATYIPILHRYRCRPLWAIFLPIISLLYLTATIGSAIRHFSGANGSSKRRNHRKAKK